MFHQPAQYHVLTMREASSSSREPTANSQQSRQAPSHARTKSLDEALPSKPRKRERYSSKIERMNLRKMALADASLWDAGPHVLALSDPLPRPSGKQRLAVAAAVGKRAPLSSSLANPTAKAAPQLSRTTQIHAEALDYAKSYGPAHQYRPSSWPADIVASPRKGFLWEYFIHILETRFLCLDVDDVKRLTFFQDPYATIMPSIALSSPPVRSAILCFAATQYEIRNGRATDLSSQELFVQASRAFMSLTPNSEDPIGLLPAVAAGLFLQFHDNGRGNFLDLARSAAAFILGSKSSQNYIHDHTYQTVMAMLRWVDISTLCSLSRPAKVLDDSLHRLIEMSESELNYNFSMTSQGWISHPIFAFSPWLVNPLLKLGRYVHLQSQTQPALDLEAVPNSVVSEDQLLELEEDILNATDSFRTACQKGIADSAALISLNESMFISALLLFYTRLRYMPMTASLIRRYVKEIVRKISLISVNSRVSHALIFPLYVAGCEAMDLKVRDCILRRIKLFNGVLLNRGDRLVRILQHVWQIRDANPELIWQEWTSKGLIFHPPFLQLNHESNTAL